MNDTGPRWCDLDCPEASFPETDGLDGACHTFIALYCRKYDMLVHKNALCLDRKKRGKDDGED
jgi:hypothetical protein